MKTNFRHIKKGNLEYFTVPAFEETGLVKHCITTRRGGVSVLEKNAMNLSFKCGESRETVLENYHIICDAIGVDDKKLILSNQVHDNKVYIATGKDCGKGIYKESDIIGYDGLITAESGVPICTFYADCTPLLFLDPQKKIIASVHSGWRSTLAKIGTVAVEKMKTLGSNPSDILAAIGPSIGPCHFEVGMDVAEKFIEVFGADIIAKRIADKAYINLWQANAYQLLQMGIPDNNITVAEICTYCNNDIFYSYRADGKRMGSLGGIMELR